MEIEEKGRANCEGDGSAGRGGEMILRWFVGSVREDEGVYDVRFATVCYGWIMVYVSRRIVDEEYRFMISE